jgi:hypothetical protein
LKARRADRGEARMNQGCTDPRRLPVAEDDAPKLRWHTPEVQVLDATDTEFGGGDPVADGPTYGS